MSYQTRNVLVLDFEVPEEVHKEIGEYAKGVHRGYTWYRCGTEAKWFPETDKYLKSLGVEDRTEVLIVFTNE